MEEKEKPIIFIVDDEHDILENYIDLLSDSYRVRTFQDPDLFLKEIKEIGDQKPNLVITDLKMPSMDGVEMIRKAQKTNSFFPFILLSGYLDKKSVLEAVDLGVYRLLEKPCEYQDLLSTIDQLLVEHDIHLIRNDIRKLSLQLKELYSNINLVMTQYIPEDVLNRLVVEASNGEVQNKMSFENLLNHLDKQFSHLINSEKILNEMRLSQFRD